MRWSVKLGRFAGIDVYLHVTFLLLLAFIGAGSYLSEGTFGAAARGVGFFTAVFACVLLHEFGHALTARRFGIRTRDITLLPIGGVARLERIPDRPIQELWVALAGPAVNVVIIGILLAWLVLSRTAWTFGGFSSMEGSMAVQLLRVNVFLVLFNMIPAFPMDGGRVLRALLAFRMDYARATQIAASLGQGIAMVFALFGLMGLLGKGGNPLLLFIALFVWIGASQEAGLAQFRSNLSGVRVRDVMLTHYSTLAPHDQLARAVELVMAGSQQDFPVVDRRMVVGVLTRQRLLGALAEGGKTGFVADAMDRNVTSLDADEPIERVMASQEITSAGLVPVIDRGELIGLVTWDNIMEYVLIRSALRSPASNRGIPPVLASR